MCDAKKSWPLYIFVLEASYRQEKKNYIQTKFITMNGLFLRISTARIRHPDQQARIFIFKPCIMKPFQPRRPLCIRVQKYCFAML